MAKGRSQRQEQRSGSLRCAIYTRKSTEEGLNQEFNSLDAQREACEAYIISQRHEGWLLVPDYYDDGGISGGTMERPGLKRLLADVRSGKVDVIVVYKVDRLTRALSDFAKIVDILDAAEASFVSITQAFNTTTSMGRLTLNVLLSFAQFEREVISERVRDKIAASKTKGMWMGGCVPLGYQAKDRKLIVDEAEAQIVRRIFQRYLELGTVRALLDDLRATGVVTKSQIMRDGSLRGSNPFSRGALHYFLKNRIYCGDIVHHDKVYPGEHGAIVPEALFDDVQALLASNIGDRRSGKHFTSPSLLAGMIRDGAGRPMSPSHTLKGGKRYRYYVSNEPSVDQPALAMRLPAKTLEASVIAALLRATDDTASLIADSPIISATEITRLRSGQQKFAEVVRRARTSTLRPMLLVLDLRIVIENDGISASLCKDQFLKLIDPQADWSSVSERMTITVPASLQRRGQELKLRVDPVGGHDDRDPKLIALLIRAHAAREQLAALDMTAPRDLRRELVRVARIAYLAPDIVAAIVEGRQPGGLRSRKLERGDLPLCWKAQREMLGFG
ncbi:recombinase family protein [Sphingomonas sp. RB1R13]|uniref:recombinase family protein n=1 Tax=Sphingomonas sp. RB1R13 TaxID=3096159 RepID=UPI002FC8A089